jgi:hypothetical protein
VLLDVPCEHQTCVQFVLFVPTYTSTHFNKAFFFFHITHGFTVRSCHFIYPSYEHYDLLFTDFHGNFK